LPWPTLAPFPSRTRNSVAVLVNELDGIHHAAPNS
jgi:hypothetical protein